jgi:hypothetical protein
MAITRILRDVCGYDRPCSCLLSSVTIRLMVLATVERPMRPLSSMGMTSVRHPLLCDPWLRAHTISSCIAMATIRSGSGLKSAQVPEPHIPSHPSSQSPTPLTAPKQLALGPSELQSVAGIGGDHAFARDPHRVLRDRPFAVVEEIVEEFLRGVRAHHDRSFAETHDRLQRSRASGRVANVRDPAALAACEPNRFGLAVEADRRRLEPGASGIVERVDVHDRVCAFVDLARHDRHHAAPRAHVELRGARAVLVARHPLGIHDRDRQRARRVRGPHAAMLRAERAATRARDDRRRFRLPRQVERDVPAVTRAVDHHARRGSHGAARDGVQLGLAVGSTDARATQSLRKTVGLCLDVLKSVVIQYP